MKMIVKEKSLSSFVLFLYIYLLLYINKLAIYLNLICTLLQYARIFKFLDFYRD